MISSSSGLLEKEKKKINYLKLKTTPVTVVIVAGFKTRIFSRGRRGSM